MRTNRKSNLKVPLSLIFLLVLGLLAALAASPVFAGNHGEDRGNGPPENLKVQARPVFDIEGVVFTDAKEDGFVEIGVAKENLVGPVRNKLGKLGLPLDSFQIVVTKPIVPLTTLQDRVRPLEGGLQITFVDFPFAYSCTLGFNAVRAGVNGFAVNAHCTEEEGALDGVQHYQNDWSNANDLVGQEIADPAPFDCDAGGGNKCRWSDSAYDQLAAGVDITLGAIAKTTGPNNGDLTIAGSFNIVGEAAGDLVNGTAPVGTVLNKVGRTTGWTQGEVTATCVDTAAQGSNIVRLCQDFVAAEVGGGDSGSPVFAINSGDDVTLYGILWGGSSDGTSFVYSPIVNVEEDLGALNTFVEGPTTDIAVTGVSAPASAVLGEVVSVDVTVENTGSQDVASDINVTLTDDTDGVIIGSQTIVGGLTAGASTTLTYSWDTTGSSLANHTLTGSHDFADDDATNDSKSAVVTVEAPVTDIAVTAVSAPASAVKGDVVSVDVTVENTGNQDVASDINVTLTDGTDGVAIGTQTITGGLAAGASTTLTYSWDTTTASLGDHTLTGRHNFADDDATNNSKSTTVTVNEPVSGTMHVGDLDGSSTKLTKGAWSAQVTIEVHDATEAAVEAASVTGTFTQNGTTVGTFSCTTGATGRCTIDSGQLPSKNGKATFTVGNVTDTLTYDAAANHDPDGDSDGTTIAVSK